jgi:hypothetical protein
MMNKSWSDFHILLFVRTWRTRVCNGRGDDASSGQLWSSTDSSVRIMSVSTSSGCEASRLLARSNHEKTAWSSRESIIEYILHKTREFNATAAIVYACMRCDSKAGACRSAALRNLGQALRTPRPRIRGRPYLGRVLSAALHHLSVGVELVLLEIVPAPPIAGAGTNQTYAEG